MSGTVIYANTLAQSGGKRLDGERLRRIVDAKNVVEAIKMLGDYGFAPCQSGSIDEFIIAETNAFIEFLQDTAPNEKVLNALVCPYTYNNAKLAYKARFVEVSPDAYYQTGVDPTRITAGDYSECDKYLENALVELDGQAEKNPRVIDAEITRAMYKSALSCGAKLIKKYFRAEIDLKNILSAARMYKLGKADYAAEYIEGGKIDFDSLEEAAKGKNFALCFYGTPYADIAEKQEKSEFKSLGSFERDADDYLFYMTDSLCQNMSGLDPYLNFYTERRVELKTVKTALVCIKSGARDEFFSRVPEIYR